MKAIYAVKNRDDATRLSSSSGGVFLALCEWAISEAGVVYGVGFDSSMRVTHARAETMDACRRFSGSKYTQSDIGLCYQRVQEDLLAGRLVLFSGTPCQAAGLRSYLSAVKSTGRLFVVDVICHGVMSPRIWHDHIELVRSHVRGDLTDYRFRDKTDGWRDSSHRAYTFDRSYSDHLVNGLRDVFTGNYALRPSCHRCPFANLDRVGDLTMGDYWGVEAHFPELDDDRGVSLVLVNSDAGLDLLGRVKDQIERWPVEVDQCMQPNLSRPTPPQERRAEFWRLYLKRGYRAAIRRYTDYGLVRRSLRRARRVMRYFL